jgi:hypothetical protein
VFVHYSSNFWRKTGSKRASLNCFGPGVPERAPASRVAPRPWLGPDAEALLRPLVHARCLGHCAPGRLTRSRGRRPVPRGTPELAGASMPSRHWLLRPPHVAAPLAHVVPMPQSAALERKGNSLTTALCPPKKVPRPPASRDAAAPQSRRGLPVKVAR